MHKLFILLFIFINGVLINSLLASNLWEKLFYQYNRDFYQAEVLDSLNCVALGETKGFFISRLIKTTDGGNSWVSILKDEDVFLEPETRGGIIKVNCISFFRKDGIALGCDTGRILVTNNGGMSWQRIELGTKSNVKSISITAEGIGYCVTESSVYKTFDDGQTWNRVILPFQVKLIDKIYCFDKSNAIMHLLLTNSKGFLFVRTKDAGLSWEYSTFPHGGSCHDLCFVNDSVGWSVHFEPDLKTYRDLKDYIIKTTNGGIDWTIVKNEKNKPYDGLNSVHFFDENTGFASGKSGKLYFSEDGGITWKRDYCSSEDDFSFDIQKVRFLTKTKALAFTSIGYIYKWDKNNNSISDFKENDDYVYYFSENSIFIQIREALLSKALIFVYDIYGREIQNLDTFNNLIAIDLSSYPTGTYLIKLYFNDKNKTIKLVKI